jgi:hypothetical protein
MADYLSDNSETTAQLETLYSVTDVPDREPTNDGPDDNGFADALTRAVSLRVDGMFPPATMTALREYNVKN